MTNRNNNTKENNMITLRKYSELLANAIDKCRYLVYTKSMTNNNNTKENKMAYKAITNVINFAKPKRKIMIEKLETLGAVNVTVNGQCWSMTLPNGKKWSGGIGAVRTLIDNNLALITPRRATVRLEADLSGKSWTTQNGG
jgi:hypothetical protein